ncbi:hypothetical protein FKM82_029154 [Ascaphus truei]
MEMQRTGTKCITPGLPTYQSHAHTQTYKQWQTLHTQHALHIDIHDTSVHKNATNKTPIAHTLTQVHITLNPQTNRTMKESHIRDICHSPYPQTHPTDMTSHKHP